VRAQPELRRVAARALRRAGAGLPAVAQASLAAALAWLLAHRVLGHSQPFFAPIAAAVTLSTSRIQRARRIVQLLAGVLVGIGVAELLVALLGTSVTTLGVIVFVTLLACVIGGAGFVGEGMMFANQAAAAAILVVALHKHGTGSERALDAAVGGAVALIVGVLLFPAEPLSMLADAERAVLSALAAALEHCVQIQGRADAEPMWAIETGREIHRRLAALAMARTTARANVRIAPRRWRLRAAVDAEGRRTAYLDLLANAVLSLVRAATREQLGARGPLLADQISVLSGAIARLAEADRPWPVSLLAQTRAATQAAIDRVGGLQTDRDGVVASILIAMAIDLERAIDPMATFSNPGRLAQ
jgi:uncharacterized membrane protein YgaE (UPF0421/DUF939 family)